MRKILKFLDVPWNDSVLHHEEFINKPNGVSLSKYVAIVVFVVCVGGGNAVRTGTIADGIVRYVHSGNVIGLIY